MIRFSPADGERLEACGLPHLRKERVYLHRMELAFEVQNRRGVYRGKPGDYVAYDPFLGDVWLVPAAEKAKWYDPLDNSKPV